MPFIQQLAEQMGGQVAGNTIGAAMGLALGGIERKAQLKQQGKLQDLQIKGQQQMGEFNRQQQMKLWEDTNYSAQMEQLKKAGLNPGLMYGMSGGGGATTAANPGNVTGGQAKGDTPAAGMGMMMGQAAMNTAQMGLIKAQTDKTNAERAAVEAGIPNIGKTGQEIETRIENIKADTGNTNADTALKNVNIELAKLEKEFATATLGTRIEQVEAGLRKINGEIRIIETQADLDQATKNDKITLIAQEAIGAALKNTLTRATTANVKADTRLKGAQTGNVIQDTLVKKQAINNMIADIRYQNRQWYLGTKQLDVENAKLKLQEHGIDLNDPNLTPQIGNILGGIIGGIMGGVSTMPGKVNRIGY